MSLLVVGSVAFDAVETPFGKRERMLGGSATHFSLAASFFTDVRVVGVVGGDFGDEEFGVFREREIDTHDLEVVPWINTVPEQVWEAVRRVHVVIINDAEARQLAGEPNLHRAARKILDAGPRALVIKRGEYGAALFTRDTYFATPAYPLESVFDPTGAGDTFAGGFMGYLASHEEFDEATMRRAMIFGSVMASFNVEEFGTERVRRLTPAEINGRFREFKRMTHFEEIPFERAAGAAE
ncbi:MAG: PfkB family carbohydrate kinase [Acidobacteria bacterium]|nr:PfkB family carbohydrate kinase [Acidobacteriota bacterium]